MRLFSYNLHFKNTEVFLGVNKYSFSFDTKAKHSKRFIFMHVCLCYTWFLLLSLGTEYFVQGIQITSIFAKIYIYLYTAFQQFTQ